MNRNIFTIAVFFLICLSFNYTFPLHSMRKKIWPIVGRVNRTKTCAPKVPSVNVTYNRPAATSPWGEATVTIETLVPQSADHDITNYEHLVIMKKYPFLDMKDLSVRLNPFYKRPSRKLVAPALFRADQGLCGQEEGLNVEISNRGLSGVSLPLPFASKFDVDKQSFIL